MAFVDPNAQAPVAVASTQATNANPAPAASAGPVSAGGAGVAGSQAANVPGQNVQAQPSAQLSAYLVGNAPQTNTYAGTIAGTLGANTAAAGNAINPAV